MFFSKHSCYFLFQDLLFHRSLKALTNGLKPKPSLITLLDSSPLMSQARLCFDALIAEILEDELLEEQGLSCQVQEYSSMDKSSFPW